MPFTLCDLCGNKGTIIARGFLSIKRLTRIKRVTASATSFRVIVP